VSLAHDGLSSKTSVMITLSGGGERTSAFAQTTCKVGTDCAASCYLHECR
jgi:hypothetical protein